MVQTGYLATRPRRPASLITVIALHGAVLSALVLYRTEAGQFINDAIPLIYIVPAAKPPEPVRPVEKQVTQTGRAQRPVAEPDTSTAVGTATSDYLPVPGSLDGLAHDFGNDIGPIEPINPVVHDPVIVGAMPGPGFARSAQPPYPPGLQRAEIEGSVTVRVQIDVDGRVAAIEQVSADQPEFFAATRDWAKRNWRFTPATRDGVPVTSWRTMTVHFQMGR